MSSSRRWLLVGLAAAVGGSLATLWISARPGEADRLGWSPAAGPVTPSPPADARTPAPSRAERPSSVPRRTATATPTNGEPVIRFGRFKGWTKPVWREYYAERLAEMRRERDEASRVVERAERGEPVSAEELGQAHVRIRDLTLRIERDEQDLEELEFAR